MVSFQAVGVATLTFIVVASLAVIMQSPGNMTDVLYSLQSAVEKAGAAPTSAERRKMTAAMSSVANLLATEELYNIVADDERANPHKKGFVSWVHALSSSKSRADVERKVRDALQDPNSPYGQQIQEEIPLGYHSLLPALSSQVAQEATEAAFSKLKSQMVKAGEWDKGYLQEGNNLVGNPLNFGDKYKGNKDGLSNACRQACVSRIACRGYTYQPSQGICYLKTVASPVKGVDCTKDCWYWGRVVGHPHEMSLSLEEAERDLGLKVKDTVVGTGAELQKGQTATIGYVGRLDSGKVFDQGQYVFTFGRGQVIKGDDLGLQGMRVGGRRSLTIPADLGYGWAGYGNLIPPGARLHFDVRLLNVNSSPVASGYKSSDSPT